MSAGVIGQTITSQLLDLPPCLLARTDHVLGPQMVQPFLIVSSDGQLTVTDSRQYFLVHVDSMSEQFVDHLFVD